MSHVKRPGYMLRAVVAWFILNVVLLITLGLPTYLLGDLMDRWYVMGPVIIAVIVSECMITGETILPVIKSWITQEEYVSDGQRPSWEKSK